LVVRRNSTQDICATRGGAFGLKSVGSIVQVASERALFAQLIELIRRHVAATASNDQLSCVYGIMSSCSCLYPRVDPDILIGYEIERESWGYLRDRGQKLGINIISEFSRVPKHDSTFTTNTITVSGDDDEESPALKFPGTKRFAASSAAVLFLLSFSEKKGSGFFLS
jgi:hypothetical protein